MKFNILIFTLLCSLNLVAAPIPSDLKDKLESYLDNNKFVGLSVLVLSNDGDEFVSHYGNRDLSKNIKPNDDTVYEIGSISKAFARISLAAQREIQLKDNISTYLPNSVRIPMPAGKEITIENLITHTGIKFSVPCTIRLPNPNDLICFGIDLELTDPYKNTSQDKNLKFLTEFSYTVEEFPQHFPEPGTFYSYSNVGIGLVGEFLGKEFNTSFEEYLAASVLNPLGMTATKIEMPCEQSNTCKNLAKVYSKSSLNKNWTEASLWHLPGLSAAGGVRSSLNDMKIFLKANLTPENTPIELALKAAQSPLEYATELHNSNICQEGQQPQSDLCNPAKKNFYYAWETVSNDTVFYHAGATRGSQAMMMFSVDQSVGVVVLSNSRVVKGEQSPFHYPNDVALCIYQLLGKPVAPNLDFCQRL